MWHGWADPLISAQGTVDYYTGWRRQMGGAPRLPNLFGCSWRRASGIAPAAYARRENGSTAGLGRGRPGAGNIEGQHARPGGVTRTRPLCQYPLVARYRGTGSTDDAANFACSAGFKRRTFLKEHP